jgi:hypothetical protein
VLSLVDLYTPDEIKARLKFLTDMRGLGVKSDTYQGQQVFFNTRAELTDEINLYRAARVYLLTGVMPPLPGQAFRILDGYGLRNDREATDGWWDGFLPQEFDQ